jgi:small subunit ribosomal protein S20
MPNCTSAKKRLRQNVKRQLNNRIRKSRIKTFQSKFASELVAGNLEAAQGALCTCFAALDKAAKVGSIHRNKADRTKSRLAKRLAKAKAAAVSA